MTGPVTTALLTVLHIDSPEDEELRRYSGQRVTLGDPDGTGEAPDGHIRVCADDGVLIDVLPEELTEHYASSRLQFVVTLEFSSGKEVDHASASDALLEAIGDAVRNNLEAEFDAGPITDYSVDPIVYDSARVSR